MKKMNEKYQVLWIDDQPQDVFADEAYGYGINITICTNYEEGITQLKDSSQNYDAIILDAYCKSTPDPNEVADIKSLTEGMHEVAHLCKKNKIPWFVYSGGTNEEDLNSRILNKHWDSKAYYKKPSERKELFEKIIETVKQFNNINWIIKNKYADVFELFEGRSCVLDSSQKSELIQIISVLEQSKEKEKNTVVFNQIRQFIEAALVPKLKDLGVVHSKTYYEKNDTWNNTTLNDVARLFTNWDYQARIPAYIGQCFRALISLVQEGSHNNDDTDLLADTASGRAPYLVQTSILLLLNVLTWLKDFSTNYADKADNIKFFTPKPSPEIRVGDVVKTKLDRRGYLCSENILLGAYQPGTNANREVVLTRISINTKPNRHIYYYIGEFEEKR